MTDCYRKPAAIKMALTITLLALSGCYASHGERWAGDAGGWPETASSVDAGAVWADDPWGGDPWVDDAGAGFDDGAEVDAGPVYEPPPCPPPTTERHCDPLGPGR